MPYTESDQPAPLNVYGQTKLDGEERIQACLSHHIIIRTSGVFSADGNNFVKTMLKLATGHNEIRVINNQICCPTAANDIADAVINITTAIREKKDPDFWGTYHFCSSPPVTWFDFAATIFEFAEKRGHPVPRLIPIKSSEYPSPTIRPAYSVLDCSKITRQFGFQQPLWKKSLAQVIKKLTGDAMEINS